jgi:hypothetical protein
MVQCVFNFPPPQEEVAPIRKKRQYKRRQKQTQPSHATAAAIAAAASFGDVDIMPDIDSSEDDMLSPSVSKNNSHNVNL